MASHPYETVVISSGQTVSAEFDLRGKKLHAIKTPAALTGTTLSFQAAEKPTAQGGSYVGVRHLATLASTATTITSVAADQWIVIESGILPEGIENCMLKLVSGSAEAADRTFILDTLPCD